MAHLVANNGPDAGRRYEIRSPQCILGRHPDCQIVVDVGAVSRQHAQIVCERSKYYLEDLKSRNGTYLNDELVQGRKLLHHGDQIRVCDVAYTFHQEVPLTPSLVAPGTPIKDLDPSSSSGSDSRRTVLVDDMKDSGSTIMSKLDVSSRSGRLQLTASPETKLNALIEITQSLGKALALDEVLSGVLNSLFKIFVQADRGFIVMKTEDGDLRPLWTKVRREDDADTMRISRTIVRQVMESKEAILSADAAADDRFEMSQSIADFRIRSMMCGPLLDSEGNAMGVLQVDTLDQRKRFQAEDLEVLVGVAAQAGIAIDNAQMHERALRQKAIERDLEVAHEVQKGFLPEQKPQCEGYDFFDFYRPANHIGGDYYDYIHLQDGRVAILVADVVGHGIAAALLMAKLAAEAKFSLASEPDVSLAVNRLNDSMSNLQLDRFVTMIMAVLDPKTHEAVIVNAGHMAPLLLRADGTVEEPGEDISGLPLGIAEGLEYEPLTITLAPGELMAMYTDGINEAANADNQMYGIDRIRDHIKSAGNASAEAVGQKILADMREFLEGSTQEDDMCLVCFRRLPP